MVAKIGSKTRRKLKAPPGSAVVPWKRKPRWIVQNHAGQPTKYRSEYAKQVVEFCAQGYSLTAFAGHIGIGRRTLDDWQNAHPEFADACKRTNALRSLWWEERAREVASGSTMGNAAMIMFALINHAPGDFKSKSQLEHTGKDGAPLGEIPVLTPDERRERARAMIREAFAPRIVEIEHERIAANAE